VKKGAKDKSFAFFCYNNNGGDNVNMHLEKEIYELVKNGIKDVEIRINDEKRRRLKVGDIITIINRGNEETMNVKIVSLEYFSSFSECADNFDIRRLYSDNFNKEEYVKLLYNFYNEEEENEYGVVAIIFTKV